MTKGGRLIWELFEMVRELMPPTQANAERFQRWSEKFNVMEGGAPLSEDAQAAVDTADHDEVQNEAPVDPHEHGTPTRRRRK